jgi:hypothetical protein
MEGTSFSTWQHAGRLRIRRWRETPWSRPVARRPRDGGSAPGEGSSAAEGRWRDRLRAAPPRNIGRHGLARGRSGQWSSARDLRISCGRGRSRVAAAPVERPRGGRSARRSDVPRPDPSEDGFDPGSMARRPPARLRPVAGGHPRGREIGRADTEATPFGEEPSWCAVERGPVEPATRNRATGGGHAVVVGPMAASLVGVVVAE